MDDSQNETDKLATFEWCLSWTDLASALSYSCLPMPTGVEKQNGLVIVAGSGTSTLSHDLYEYGGYHHVVSIDKDKACTQHMQVLYPHLTWITSDLTTCGTAARAVQGYNSMREEVEEVEVVGAKKCVLAVDKSTLDCILADCEQGNHLAAGYILNLCDVQ